MSHGELFARPAWKCLQELFGGRQVPPQIASGIPQADFGEAMKFWKMGKPENVFQKHLWSQGIQREDERSALLFNTKYKC